MELKQSLIRKLLQTDDQTILKRVKSILIPVKEDVLCFSDELREKINVAIEQADNNELIDSDDLEKEARKWLADSQVGAVISHSMAGASGDYRSRFFVP